MSILLLFRKIAKEGNIIGIHDSVLIRSDGSNDHTITGITDALLKSEYQDRYFRDGSHVLERYMGTYHDQMSHYLKYIEDDTKYPTY